MKGLYEGHLARVASSPVCHKGKGRQGAESGVMANRPPPFPSPSMRARCHRRLDRQRRGRSRLDRANDRSGLVSRAGQTERRGVKALAVPATVSGVHTWRHPRQVGRDIARQRSGVELSDARGPAGICPPDPESSDQCLSHRKEILTNAVCFCGTRDAHP
jgi:hypothetical protein